MKSKSTIQRYLPSFLWVAALIAIYFTLNALIAQLSGGITLNGKIVSDSIKQLAGFLFGIIGGLVLIEIYFYQIFFSKHKNASMNIVV